MKQVTPMRIFLISLQSILLIIAHYAPGTLGVLLYLISLWFCWAGLSRAAF